MQKQIPTYIINLEKRIDRKVHILEQFNNRLEFKLQIVKAFEDKNGAMGLWNTICHIIQNLTPKNEEYVLICEDDHEFTNHFNAEMLLEAINEAKNKNADILMGGMSWFTDALQVNKKLFWVDQFTGTQFIVIYRNFFDTLLQAYFLPGDTADRKIAALSSKKFCMYPFISIQKEFGYSDATEKNNMDGYVTQIFNDTSEKLGHLVKVASFYELALRT